MTDEEYTILYDRVDDAIAGLISELPNDIQEDAKKIPCLLDAFSPIDNHPEALGCCMQGLENSPIFIYVEAIYAAEGGNVDGVCKSARQVYLHELGHALGLSEIEVRERGV